MIVELLLVAALSAKTTKQVPPPPSLPQPATPYDFRGARLGITLGDFKQLAFPDAGEVAEKYHGTRGAQVELACSGSSDPGFNDPKRVYATEEFRKANGVKCMYKVPPSSSGYHSFWDDAVMMVGTVTSTDVMYLFYPDESGSVRLGDIIIVANNHGFDSLAAALIGKLGPPTKTSDDDLQNGVGNHFKSTVLLWDNGVSTVKLEQRHGKISDMQLSYSNTALSHGFYERIAAAEPPKL